MRCCYNNLGKFLNFLTSLLRNANINMSPTWWKDSKRHSYHIYSAVTFTFQCIFMWPHILWLWSLKKLSHLSCTDANILSVWHLLAYFWSHRIPYEQCLRWYANKRQWFMRFIQLPMIRYFVKSYCKSMNIYCLFVYVLLLLFIFFKWVSMSIARPVIYTEKYPLIG